jgi:hypothetical protein
MIADVAWESLPEKRAIQQPQRLVHKKKCHDDSQGTRTGSPTKLPEQRRIQRLQTVLAATQQSVLTLEHRLGSQFSQRAILTVKIGFAKKQTRDAEAVNEALVVKLRRVSANLERHMAVHSGTVTELEGRLESRIRDLEGEKSDLNDDVIQLRRRLSESEHSMSARASRQKEKEHTTELQSQKVLFEKKADSAMKHTKVMQKRIRDLEGEKSDLNDDVIQLRHRLSESEHSMSARASRQKEKEHKTELQSQKVLFEKKADSAMKHTKVIQKRKERSIILGKRLTATVIEQNRKIAVNAQEIQMNHDAQAILEDMVADLRSGLQQKFLNRDGSYTNDFRVLCYRGLSKRVPPQMFRDVLIGLFKDLDIEIDKVPSVSTLSRFREEFTVIAAGCGSEALTSTLGGVVKKRFNSVHGDASTKGMKNGAYSYSLMNTTIHTVAYDEHDEVVEDRLIHLPMTEPQNGTAEKERDALNRASELAVKARSDVAFENVDKVPRDVALQHINDCQVFVSDSCVTAKNVSALLIEQRTKAAVDLHGVEKLALMSSVERAEVMGGLSVDCVRHLVHLLVGGMIVGLNGFAAVSIGNWDELSSVGDVEEGKVAGVLSIIWDLVSGINFDFIPSARM